MPDNANIGISIKNQSKLAVTIYTAFIIFLGVFGSLLTQSFLLPVALLSVMLTGLLVSRSWFRKYCISVIIGMIMLSSLFSRFEVTIASFSVRWEHIVGIIGLIGVITYLLFKRRKFFRISFLAVVVFLWGIVNLISSLINAPDPKESLILVGRLSILVIIYLVVSNVYNKNQTNSWVKIYKFWLFLGLFEAAYGVIVWLLALTTTSTVGVQIAFTNPTPTPFGTMLEGNIFGSYMASNWIMWLYIIIAQRKLRRQMLIRTYVGWLALGTIGVALIISQARAAWVSALLGTVVVFFLTTKHPKDMMIQTIKFGFAGGLATLAILMFSLTNAGSPVLNRFDTLAKLNEDPTWQARVVDWTLAIDDWKEHPIIGNGTGAFAQIHGLRRGKPAWVSNMFLHSLVDTGVLGLLLQLVIFIPSIALVFVRYARRKYSIDSAHLSLVALSLGLFVLLIAYQATEATWFATIWIQLGMLHAGMRLVKKNKLRNVLT